MKILLICHGERHDFGCPPFSDLLSKKALDHSITLDIDSKSEPDIETDIRYSKALKGYSKKFDIMFAICCTYDAFIKKNGEGIETNAFENILKALKRGGIFVLIIPEFGAKSILKYFNLPIKRDYEKKAKDALGIHLSKFSLKKLDNPMNDETFKKYNDIYLNTYLHNEILSEDLLFLKKT